MPAFFTGPLLKYAIMALMLAALVGTIYVQHLKLAERDALILAKDAQIGECTAANSGFANRIKQFTEEVAKAKAVAADAQRLLDQQIAASTQATTDIQKEVIRVAVPSDDVVSPALDAALSGLRKSGSGSHDPASASRGETTARR